MPAPWKSIHESLPSDRRAEVIVIGSGAAGQSVAKRLAATGVDVLVVEAGPASETHRKSQEVLQAAMPAIHRQYPDFGSHLLMNLGGSIGKPQMPMSADGVGASLKASVSRRWRPQISPIGRSNHHDLDAVLRPGASEWFDMTWDRIRAPATSTTLDCKTAAFQVVSRRTFSHPSPVASPPASASSSTAPVSRLDCRRERPGDQRTRCRPTAAKPIRLEADTFVLATNTMPATQLLMNSGLATEQWPARPSPDGPPARHPWGTSSHQPTSPARSSTRSPRRRSTAWVCGGRS